MNNRGQLGGVVAFVIIVIMLIIVAPVILKVGTSILGQTSLQLSTMETNNQSADTVRFVETKLTGTMDWVIMILILFNILILFISAFLIDVNPAFVIIYIIGAMVLVIGAPYSIMAAEKIYSMSTFSDAISFIPMSQFLMNNFGVFIVGVIVVTGIIIFAKTKYGFSGGGGNVY